MRNQISANSLKSDRNLDSMERLATLKTRAKMNIQLVQTFLIGIEYLTYIFTFIFLFAYKVLPDYPGVSPFHLLNWIEEISIVEDYVWFIFFFLLLFFLSLYQKQFYSIQQERSLSEEIVVLARTLTMCFLITIGITFVLKITMVYSRLLLTLFLLSTFIQASGFRYLRKLIFFRYKTKGKIIQNILIVGAGRIGKQLKQSFQQSKTDGYRVVGFLDDIAKDDDVIGDVHDLEQVIHKHQIDIVYITIPSEKRLIDSLLRRIYKYNLDIRIIPELYDRMLSIYEYRQDGGFPYLQIVKTPLRGINLVVKRLMDVVLSLQLLVMLIPLWICISIAIKGESKGPIIFKQKRLGVNGVPFTMYKFRSMIDDAEQMKEVLARHNQVNGPAFKVKDDPRVTKVGSFIRKYSIDELPQLINVLKGEMSLIGPRPPLPSEVKQYTDYQWRRMDVRPGMTGLWQVSGRSDLTFDEWVDLDIQYIERWSVALEFKILLKTIPVVFHGKGAY